MCLCSETSWCPHFLSCFQVWETVSSEDVQATWGVEWGSVARWAVAITAHFKISDQPTCFHSLVWDVERESYEHFQDHFLGFPFHLFIHAQHHYMLSSQYTDLFHFVATISDRIIFIMHAICCICKPFHKTDTLMTPNIYSTKSPALGIVCILMGF
jgi:hypothetical protein